MYVNFSEGAFEGLMLNVTDDCNLRCKYCFVQYQPHYMPLQIAKDSLDLIVDVNRRNEREGDGQINLFGGEPMLCWDSIVVPLIQYRNLKEYKTIFGMTTNCTLLNQERLEFLAANQVNLLCSIDGIKETQDFNRPCRNGESSFDKLIPILSLLPRYISTAIFRGTLYPPTCHTLFESIMFAADLGFGKCYFTPDAWSEWTEDKKEILAENLRKYSLYFIECFRKDITPIMFNPLEEYIKYLLASNLNNFTKFSKSPKKLPACGLGIQVASVNYEGKLFACQQTDTWETGNPYYIGDIYNGINPKRHKQLLDEYLKDYVCEDPSKCTNCFIKSICNIKGCHSVSYSKYKNLHTKPVIDCYWSNLLAKEALFIINVMTANNNQKFINLFVNNKEENK